MVSLKSLLHSVSGVSGALALLLGASALAATPDASLSRQDAYNASQAAIGKPVPGDVLQGRGGKQVRLSDYRGKPLLVSFIYTGCFQTCPTDTVQIARAVTAIQDLLGADAVHVATIGFNVPFDSPEAMAAFARERRISTRNWDFLSPSPANVASLTRDFGFSYVATPKGFDHITQLTVVDREGRIYRQLYADNLNAQSIVSALRDMDNGVVPVSAGWSGVLARIRLLCSVYDRDSGAYRADYSLIVGMLAGASILGSVGWFLLKEWRASRRELRRKMHPV